MNHNFLKWTAAALFCISVTGCHDDGESVCVVERPSAILAEAAEYKVMMIPSGVETTIDLTVELDMEVDRDIRFNIFSAPDLIEDYNRLQGTRYASVGNDSYQLGSSIVFPAGTKKAVTTLTLPEGLPDDGNPYALGIRLSASYVDYALIDTEKNSVLYIFYREGEDVPDPNADPTLTFTGGNEPTLIDGENPETVSFTVTLSKVYSEEVTVDFALDESGENRLGDSNITWTERSVTFAPGELNKTVNIVVNSLPEYDPEAHDYEQGPDQVLRLVISGVTPGNILVSGADNVEYTFTYPEPKRPAGQPVPAQQKAVVFSNFSTSTAAAATVSINKTLQQWTLEYWVRHDDNSSNYGAPYAGQWTSSASGPTEWRKRVFSPQSIPVGNVPGTSFKFWPQGDQNLGPMMEFTSGSVYSLSTGNGGFEWRPDEWVHLAITYDGTNLRYYINGKAEKFGGNATASQQTVQDYTSSYPGANGWTSISIATPGANTTYTRYYKIELAQLRLWSVERSESEIQATMGMSIDPATEGLEAYWKMDEGTGTALNSALEGGATIRPTTSRMSWSTATYDFTTEGR